MTNNHQPIVVDFSVLIGKTMNLISKTDLSVVMSFSDGSIFKLSHKIEDNENVYIDDITGDLNDLLGSPILQAEESTNIESPVWSKKNSGYTSCTWAFYKIATVKGWVDIRFFGGSNSYYSTSVDLIQLYGGPDIAAISSESVTEKTIVVGQSYSTPAYDTSRLIYLGKKGQWHQFKKADDGRKVWCEVLGWELTRFKRFFLN